MFHSTEVAASVTSQCRGINGKKNTEVLKECCNINYVGELAQ